MTAIDQTRADRNCLRWTRIDPDLPGGLHEPKLPGDVGWDLEAMEDVTIGPMQSADVPVNAAIALPDGFYADVRNRSSMARRGLYVDQNVIDTGYRGPLFVFIRNMQLPDSVTDVDTPYERDTPTVTIRAGERIAQLVFHRAQPVWAREVPGLDNTTRGARGFGSTGT